MICFSEIFLIQSRGQQLPRIFSLKLLEPFFNIGVLRVGGRLQTANLAVDLKHLIIIPNFGHLTFLIIKHHHSKVVGHCVVNTTLNSVCQRFWLINHRLRYRQKTNARVKNQHIADLPAARLQLHGPPFSHVGVDYFGAFIVKVEISEAKKYGFFSRA